MKYFLTTLLVFVMLSASIAHANDKKCDQSLIDRSVNHVHENIDSIPEGKEALARIDNSVKNGKLDPKDKDEAIKTYLEIAVRNANGCKISEALQNKAIALFNVNKNGVKDCPKNMFLNDANAEYAKLRELDNYDEFEGMAKGRILQNMVPSVQARFAKNWEASPELRQKLIIASIQASKRKDEGCKNVGLPVAPLITEFAQ